MQKIIRISTQKHNELVDITEEVAKVVSESNIRFGLVNVYIQSATAGIMIQENWDNSVQKDVITLFNKIAPTGVWEHDR